MTRRALICLGLGLLLSLTPIAEAKKKRKKPGTSGTVKKKEEKPPRPDDKGVNEGASGRRNATEDAARAADSPQFERRP